MTSRTSGIISLKNFKNKVWWIKLSIAFILSNFFFFLLFSGQNEKASPLATPQGWVEVQIQATLLTPFHPGKKILLVNKKARLKLEGRLESTSLEGGTIVLVKEAEAASLFHHDQWEILPFMKNLTFSPFTQGVTHEIVY
jgi:hypothetical protein